MFFDFILKNINDQQRRSSGSTAQRLCARCQSARNPAEMALADLRSNGKSDFLSGCTETIF